MYHAEDSVQFYCAAGILEGLSYISEEELHKSIAKP